jgi:hypothetical protein
MKKPDGIPSFPLCGENIELHAEQYVIGGGGGGLKCPCNPFSH